MLVVAAPHGLRAQSGTINLTSSAGTLVVSTANAGFAPHAQNDQATRISLVVNESSSRLLAYTDTPLPMGVTLRVEVEGPAGAVSMGPITLGADPQEVLRGIPAGTYTGLIITYQLIADTTAGTVALSSCHVVFTLTNGI